MAELTITEHAAIPSDGSKRRAELGVVLVFSREPSPLRGFAVTEPRTIGREPDSSISVADPRVSRAHARLSPLGDAIRVEDLGSRNRTYVNGEPLATESATAPPGTVIRVGSSIFVVLADVSPYLAAHTSPFHELVGGAALDDARFRIQAVAQTTTPVLVLGETGTGKEVIARILHEKSGRSGDFVALNCAAVPSELIDAELFGHSRGAFSGASASRAGMFRAANGGTLFLDEIGELPMAVQAKLLRVLETSEVRSVGDDHWTKVDVRIVAATNRDVDDMIESNDFREDLMYRLAGLRILLPALRERIEDVPALAEHFVGPLGVRVSHRALERLMLCAWPGNVRELRNAVLAAAAVARTRGDDEIGPEDLVSYMPVRASRPPGGDADAELASQVTEALRHVDGDVSAAADKLGMSRSTLYETLRRLHIKAKAFRKK